MNKLIEDYSPNLLMDNNNISLYSIYLDEVIDLLSRHNSRTILSTGLDEEIRISLIKDRVEICHLILQKLIKYRRILKLMTICSQI